MVLTTLALVTIVTRFLPFALAYSKARRAIRSAPGEVQTLKSNAISSPIFTPWLPSAYMHSVFSLKKVQSIPSSGTLTGRTFAKRSSSFLMATLALSTFCHLSPFLGVVVGPFKMTWHFFSSASTSSGMALPAAARFSMVQPSMTLNSTLPFLTSSANRYSSTRCA